MHIFEECNLLVQDIPNNATNCQASHGRQRERRGRGRKGHTGDEDDGLDTLSEHGDEGQDKKGVLFGEALQPGESAASIDDGALEGDSELDAPLFLHLADAEQGGADDGDDDGGDEGKGALVALLRVLPAVDADGVEGANDGGADDQADEEAQRRAEPDLAAELLVDNDITVGAIKGLLEPCQEDRDDDDRLDGLSVQDWRFVLVSWVIPRHEQQLPRSGLD